MYIRPGENDQIDVNNLSKIFRDSRLSDFFTLIHHLPIDFLTLYYPRIFPLSEDNNTSLHSL